MFAAVRPASATSRAEQAPSAVAAALAEILPDTLSPREALDLIYQLKAQAAQDEE